VKKLAVGFGLFIALIGNHARADVPAGYKGTPHKGAPLTIPGRIEFEDFDDGGQDVAWRVDDHTGNFGVGGCGANTYRTDMPHPQLCLTNDPGEVDTYSMGPMMGMLYPSAAMPQSIYIGYTHGADWVKLTVNVTKAGMYKLSSTWASDPGGADAIKFQILFNDALKADVSLPGTGSYHNWVAAPDFATVSLDAGVQVLQFAPKSMHLNYDYLQLSLMLPGGGVDDGGSGTGAGGAGAGGAGAAGAGGASGGAGGAAGAATSGAAGTPGTAGSLGTAGFVGMDPLPAGGAGFGTAGSSSGSGTAGTTSGAGTGTLGAPGLTNTNTNQDSGCSLTPGRHPSLPRAPFAFGLTALTLLGGLSVRRSRRLKLRR
jgi:hypothetical protein